MVTEDMNLIEQNLQISPDCMARPPPSLSHNKACMFKRNHNLQVIPAVLSVYF